MNNKIIIKEGTNIYVAGVYAMQIEKDGIKKILYVGSAIEVNDALSRHLYHLKRGLYANTNKSVLQKYYDMGVLEFTILHTSEYTNKVRYFTFEEREQLQNALSVLEKMYIDLFKDTVCNARFSVTKCSSNKKKDWYGSRVKRSLSNRAERNPNNKYNKKMIGEIMWLKQNKYEANKIVELIKQNYNIALHRNYIYQIGIYKWRQIEPIRPFYV